MGTGKLYRFNDEGFVANVNYHFKDESPTNWWGELTLTDYVRLTEGERYILELEDERKGRCYLRKRVNRAVSGVPPRYIYHFSGTGLFE